MSLEPEIDDKVIAKCETLYKKIKEQAACVAATSDAHVWDEKPSWFDAEKFKKGQQLAHQYFVSVFLSHVVGLTILFTIPTMITPLAFTRTHSSVSKLFSRYLNVFIIVKKWYDYDPYERGSVAHKAFKFVNSSHRRVGNNMNKSVIEPGKNPVWISQYDMAVTVWCVIAPIILDPKKIGIHDMTRDKMEALMHVWACFARLLGVEDRFNIMTGSYDEAYYLATIIKEREYKPIIDKMDFPSKAGFEACKGIAIGLQPLAPLISLQGFMKYWYNAFDFKAEVPVASHFGEKMGYVLINGLLRYQLGHWLFALIVKIALFYCERNRKIIASRLEKRYPGDFVPFIPSNTYQPKELLAH